MIIIDDIEQGTDEWMQLRVGNPGASNFDKIITSTGKKSTQRQKYLYQLAGEIVTGQKAESYSNHHMEEGNTREDESRSLFEMINGVEIQQVGLVYSDDRKLYHCSPDGLLLGIAEGLELKNPSMPVHVEYLDKGVLPTKYRVQVQGSLMVTGYERWWFCSYYPGLRPLILPVDRDEKLISLLKEGVEEFCEDLFKLVEKIK